jgi:sugar lactone lactonase YvrE
VKIAVYFNDSVGRVIHAYDFDLETGSISNKRLLVDRRDSYGEPDGMIVE